MMLEGLGEGVGIDAGILDDGVSLGEGLDGAGRDHVGGHLEDGGVADFADLDDGLAAVACVIFCSSR